MRDLTVVVVDEQACCHHDDRFPELGVVGWMVVGVLFMGTLAVMAVGVLGLLAWKCGQWLWRGRRFLTGQALRRPPESAGEPQAKYSNRR